MNKIILKNSIKEIKKSYRRFLSLLLISLLGVGFFAGVKATTPDMQKTIDTYFDKENLFDVKIVSTLGLTDEDIEAVKKIEGISEVYGSYSKDVFVNIDDIDTVVKVIELTENINNVKVIDGKLPSKKNECVIENAMLVAENLKIGDKITIREELDEDEDSSFYEKELTIVGSVNSPLFISEDKGTSLLGSGMLSYYIYVPSDNINSDIYSEIYAKVDGAKQMNTTQPEYSECVDKVISNVEKIKYIRQDARYNNLMKEANEKLDDAEKELEEEKAKAQVDIDKAERDIRKGEKELADGEKELADARAKADAEIADATNKLVQAGDELNRGEIELNNKKAETEKKFEEAEAQKEELLLNHDKVMFGLEEIKTQYNMVLLGLKNPNLPPAQKKLLQANKKVLEEKTKELEETGAQILAGIKLIDEEVEKGKKQISDAEMVLQNGHSELNSGWAELNSKKAEADAEFAKAESEIADAKKKISDGKNKLADAKEEFDEKVQDAENKIFDARQELADLESPKWYILDRSSNNGYDSYVNDSKNIEKLGNVFPILFFVIAILISLTSMTRMVEEQRIELGTMKALGYANTSICIKYVIYALVATVIGGCLGMIIGFNLIPSIIMSMYQMMYPTMTESIIEFNTKYAILGLGIVSLCVIGATLYSCMKELVTMPATLMRPKPPKSGKRVFLEKIPFIWNRLGFTEKVTVRNMFRYKKRFLMTIIGIMGCTSLILTGFALKDSISNLINLQYGNVYNYDLMLSLNSSLTENEVTDLINKLEARDEIKKCTKTHIVANEAKGTTSKELDVQIVVTKDNEEFKNFIRLNDAKTLEAQSLNNEEVFLTQKAAKLLNINAGDMIHLSDNDGNEFEAKVGKIVENYVYHYVYMTSDLYEKIYDEEYSSNVLYIQTHELTEDEEDKLNQELLKDSKISSLTSTNYLKSNLAETLEALNQVVYVLIVSAGLLAFVVLYNLANVNISERIRELATIKVLGFYDKEVYDYVTKEIVLLTVIGIILGLFAGYWLSVFILKTCETEPLIFKIVSLPSSYAMSAAITVVFTIIVNFMTYFVLKKVDMIESLKSVE